MDKLEEPGRTVGESGVVIYSWPPEGRFRTLWDRVTAITTESERSELRSLIALEQDQKSTLVAYTNESGEWVDVEPDWDIPDSWLG